VQLARLLLDGVGGKAVGDPEGHPLALGISQNELAR
jgi:hypothetical protein